MYECSDGSYVSIGSIEPQFYAELLRLTGLGDDPEFAHQNDKATWPQLKERLAAVFLTRTRDEWCALMEHTDVCFAPVLTMSEAARHPHNVERGTCPPRWPASNPPRRRGSRAPPGRSSGRRPIPVSTPERCSRRGGSPGRGGLVVASGAA